MNISPIKTKRDYERALIRIEQLMDAKPGTKDGRRTGRSHHPRGGLRSQASCREPPRSCRSDSLSDGAIGHDPESISRSC